MSTLSSPADSAGALMAHLGLAANVLVAAVPFVVMVLAVYLIAHGLDDDRGSHED